MSGDNGRSSGSDYSSGSGSSDSSDSSRSSSSSSSCSSGTTSGSRGSHSNTATRPGVSSCRVWEMCCAPDSRITEQSLRRGLLAKRLTLETGWDFRKAHAGRKARLEAQHKRVMKVWLSLPCTPWSSIQNLNLNRPSAVRKKEKGREESRRMLQVCLPVLRVVTLCNGGDFYFEWPTGSQGWHAPELLEFRAAIRRQGRKVYECRVDGCSYGMRSKRTGRYLRKKWTVWTSDAVMFDKLGRRCPKDHLHDVIQGSETAASAFYPRRMAAKVAEIWATCASDAEIKRRVREAAAAARE